MGHLFPSLGSAGFFWEGGSGSKPFFRTYLFRQATFVLEVQLYDLLICLHIGCFGPFSVLRGYLGVRDRFNNFIVTCLCRQLTLVLKVQPNLSFQFGLISGIFCSFWAFWGDFWARGRVHKFILRPTDVDSQFWFWNYSPIFLFLMRPHFGPFRVMWCYFLGWGQVQKLLWNLLT